MVDTVAIVLGALLAMGADILLRMLVQHRGSA